MKFNGILFSVVSEKISDRFFLMKLNISLRIRGDLMYEKFLNNTRLRRFTVLALVILVLFLVRDFMTPILLTFIFTLISVKIVKFIQRYIKAPTFLLATVLYLIELWLLYLLVSKYSTILINQVVSTYNSIVHFYQHKEFNSDVVTN